MSRPSGWYDDPQDSTILRYFDGVVWTDHTTPKISPTASSSTIGHAASPESFRHRDPQDDPGHQGQQGRPGPSPQHGQQTPWQQPGGQRAWQYPELQQTPPREQRAPWPPTDPNQPVYAGWWARAGAMVLDWIIVTLVWLPLGIWLLGPEIDKLITYVQQVYIEAASNPNPSLTSSVAVPTLDTARVLGASLARTALFVAYEAWLLSSYGRTLGKIVTGIRVRQQATDANLSVGVAAWRSFVKCLGDTFGSLTVLFTVVDYLWPLWDRPQRQALHDKVARSIVVRRSR